MAVQHLAPNSSIPATRRFRVGRALLIAGLAVVIVNAVCAGLVITHWPFTLPRVTQSLQHQSESAVQIAHFRQIYFPHPGCVAEGITFRRGNDAAAPPFMTMQRLTIRGSYFGLMLHHIKLVEAEGLRLKVPPSGEAQAAATPSDQVSGSSAVKIERLVANGAEVEFPPTAERPTPLVWRVKTLLLDHVAEGRPLYFHATVQNPEPPGEIQLVGQFGPWKTGDGSKTLLSGEYRFERAQLGVFHGIAGVLSSGGKFRGVLDHIEMDGTTSVPDFEVTQAGHPVALKTEFHALVNGTNGDVELTPVKAQFAKTKIFGTGVVESREGLNGKIVDMKLSSNRARVQDLLRLFIRQDPPPMVGPIIFRAGVVLPPENQPFLKRIRLDGDFGITGGQYTNQQTQKNLDIASAKARGAADKVEDDQEKDKKDGSDKTEQDLEHVVSNVKGHVVLRAGVATFTNLSFDVPGASALVSGTYNLLNQQVDLHGTVTIDAKLSQATTGVKSFLLKIVQPLTAKKNDRGSVVSLKVTGTYRHPSFVVTPMARK